MSKPEQPIDYKDPINIYTQKLIRIFEQILFTEEVPIVCENVFRESPQFRKWVEERGKHE